MRLVTVLGTRPEIIRLSALIRRLDSSPGIEHVLVHTGQNFDYELNQVFFEDLGLRSPDRYLDVSRDSLGAACGDIISKSETAFLELKPDAVLILGDTNSALAAIMAKRLRIPIFHMEAGNRSFDENVPEEVNRRIVDHISDFNLAYTEHARRNLLAEGLPARRTFVTGSPMREVLDHQAEKIAASAATAEMGMTPGKFFLVSAHREENVDHPARLAALVDSLTRLSQDYGYPVLVSLHPRTRNRIEQAGLQGSGLVFHPPFGFSDYCRLQLDSACVLSDSGTITEEASMLGFRAVTIRDSLERPEGMDAGSIILCGLTYESVAAAVSLRMSCPPQTGVPAEYTVPDFSARVMNLVVGLTGRHRFWSGLHARPDA